jgi:hypothetical protein
MPNYANSKIYKMVSFNLPGMPYYGSTTIELSKRKGKHVSEFKQFGLGVGGCTSRIVIAAGDYDIIWVEDFPCERKDQLKARERYYIENNVCVNKNLPGRTLKEWHQANPIYKKEWHQANPTYNKEYYLANAVDIKARVSEQIQCTICNCMTRRDQCLRHQRTAKCKRLGLLIAGAHTNCQC